MSDFLTEFATSLAGAGQDEPPPRAWDALLPQLCREVAGDSAYVAALWIADDDTGARYTLWHQHKSTSASDKPCRVSIVAASPEPDDLRSAFELASEEWVGSSPAECRSIIALPLVFTDRKSAKRKTIYLGAISICLERPSAPVEEYTSRPDVMAAVNMAASWLRLNREARVMRALRDLQDQRQSVENTAQLANVICEVLKNHANARRMCAIYVPDGDGLVRLSHASAEPKAQWRDVPIARHDANSPLSDFHFGFGPSDGAGDLENDAALLTFDRSGQRLDANDVMRDIPLSALIGIEASNEPPSILLVRVRDRDPRRHGLPPAIATLVLVCEPLLDPDSESIGGTFTQTHRRTIGYVLDYFRNSYALLLQRERMTNIAHAVAGVATSVHDIMDERTDQAHLPKMAKLACDAIPSVMDAVIVEQHRMAGRDDRYYRPDAKAMKAPPWLSSPPLPHAVIEAEFRATTDISERYWGRYTIRKDGARVPEFHLFLLLRAQKLSMVESHLVEQIVAETRAELHRHLQRPKWAVQLAEVRHNLRSVVWSVRGKAEKVAALYWPVKRGKKPAEEVYSRLIRQAGYHKAVSDLEYASNELLALTENIRTISGGGTNNPLLIGTINLPDMIKRCIGLFREELYRRGLQCDFIDQSSGLLDKVTGDRHWFHILLFNLIENAVKYTRRRKVVTVRLWVEGSFWRLELINEGKHIPDSMRDAIFDDYTRVATEPGEQDMPGCGLGLASVKAIVAMHQMSGLRPPGGKAIHVDSKKDNRLSTPGLTHARNIFRISIPRLVRAGE